MPDETKDLVATLTAERGKRFDENGEAIASYVPENRRRYGSIVFLPRGTEPGKQYRVKLLAIEGKADKAGREMYRAVPASSEYSERWRDNGDGTISLVTYTLNWKLEESEEGVREMRPKATRSRVVSTKTSPQLHLGTDKTSSYIEDTPIEVWWDEEEVAQNNQVVWSRSAEREVALGGVRWPIETVLVVPGCDWHKSRLQPTYRATTAVMSAVAYLPGASAARIEFGLPANAWAELPRWCRKEIEARFPLCTCKRARVDAPASKTVCARCEVEAELVRSIDCELPAKRRAELAAEANELLAADHLTQTEGEALLESLRLDEAGTVHVTSDYAGYPWYYRKGDGIWGSKFSPEALELITRLPEARGSGLVRLAGWLVGGRHRVAELGSDYFFLTQVKGEVVEPTFSGRTQVAVAVPLADLEAIRKQHRKRAARVQARGAKTSVERATTRSAVVKGANGEVAVDLTRLFGGAARVRS